MESDVEQRQPAVVAEKSIHGESTAPPIAAHSHTSEPRPSLARSISTLRNQYGRRGGRLASVSSDTRRAAALDFLGDGTTALHYSYQDMSSDEPPKFDCPTQARSIRLVFYDTNALKAVLQKRFGSSYASDSWSVSTQDTFAFTRCEKCGAANRFRRGSDVSLYSTASSHVSPRTRPRNGGTAGPFPLKLSLTQLGRRYSHSREPDSRHESESFIYVRRSIRSVSSVWQSSSGLDDQLVTDYTKRRPYENTCVRYSDLFRLWDDQHQGFTMEVSTSIMFDTKLANEDREDKIWVRETDLPRHTLMMNDASLVFYTVPTHISSAWNPDDSFEVQAKFFTVRRRDYRKDSVLEDCLWDVLSSGRCAMELFNGNIELGSRLITLDVLTAMVLSWIDFLDVIRIEGGPKRFRHISTVTDRPLSGDREHITEFARTVRDLIEAVKITIEAIELVSKFDSPQRRAFEYILIESRARTRALRGIMDDIEENMEQALIRAERRINEGQAASVKILSVVAAVFLPLTMASSVLSMNNRVRNLGPLWWDYFGLVVVVAFFLYAGYRLSTLWNEIWKDPRLQYGLRHAKNEYRKAKEAVANRRRSEDPDTRQKSRRDLYFPSPSTMFLKMIRSFDRRGPFLIGIALGAVVAIIFRGFFGIHRYALVPWPQKVAFRISTALFAVAMMVSFIVGMFTSIQTGALTLAYSAAGAAGLLAVTVLIWRLQQVLWWIFPSIRASIVRHFEARKQGLREKSGRTNTGRTDNDPTMTDENFDKRKLAKPPWYRNKRSLRRFVLILLVFPFIASLMVVAYVATFLFGPFWLETLGQFEKNWTMAQEFADDDLSSSWSLVSRLSRSASSVVSQKTPTQDNMEPIPAAATAKPVVASDNGDGDSDVQKQTSKEES